MTGSSPAADRTSDADVRHRIEAALDAVERDEGVRILLAVESGSRAWGFPSRDSDWDLRFLYVRPLTAYLSVEPPREGIERPVEAGLDLVGWDLRKALLLLARSNAAIPEWLASPVVYRRDTVFVATLTEFTGDAAHLPALTYHYDRLARAAWPEGGGGGRMPVRLKSLFYALRPALALAWMREHHMSPPMDLDTLMAGLVLPPNLVGAVRRLRARKATGTEADLMPRCPEVNAFVAKALTPGAARPETWDRSHSLAAAEALLLRAIGGT